MSKSFKLNESRLNCCRRVEVQNGEGEFKALLQQRLIII